MLDIEGLELNISKYPLNASKRSSESLRPFMINSSSAVDTIKVSTGKIQYEKRAPSSVTDNEKIIEHLSRIPHDTATSELWSVVHILAPALVESNRHTFAQPATFKIEDIGIHISNMDSQYSQSYKSLTDSYKDGNATMNI